MMPARTLTEAEMLAAVRGAKNILLIEPEYKRIYMPLGLAKIAAYAKAHGAQVRFARHWFGGAFDLVCVSSLFTWESACVIRKLKIFEKMTKARIIVGGIYASLMPKHILENTKRAEVYCGTSPVLDEVVPLYDMDWQVEGPHYHHPQNWDEFSYVFTSRGCPNRCGYCVVWRMEPKQLIVKNWKSHIIPGRPNVVIGDNNLSDAPPEHFRDVFAHLTKTGKGVVIDSGIDCRRIDDEKAKQLAGVKWIYNGLRLAFDSMAVDGIFQKCVERLHKAGVKPGDIMSFVLYNFNDTPAEAHYRMKECKRMGVRPYPQQFMPLNQLEKGLEHNGMHWTKALCRAFRSYWLLPGLAMSMRDWVDGEYASTHNPPLTDAEKEILSVGIFEGRG